MDTAVWQSTALLRPRSTEASEALHYCGTALTRHRTNEAPHYTHIWWPCHVQAGGHDQDGETLRYHSATHEFLRELLVSLLERVNTYGVRWIKMKAGGRAGGAGWGGGGRAGERIVACISRFAIDHVLSPRRSTIPTPHRDTFSIWALSTFSTYVYYIQSSGSSIVPACASGKNRHYSGNRHYSAYYHYRLFPMGPNNFTGTIAGDRHYSTGTI